MKHLILALMLTPTLLAGGLAVDVTCEIPAPKKTIADATVMARLYEFDPRLADVAAKEVDRMTMHGVDLVKGRKANLRFPLGAKRTENRSYYVTVFVHPDAKSQKRLYYINGFQKVLQKGDAEKVAVTLTAVK